MGPPGVSGGFQVLGGVRASLEVSAAHVCRLLLAVTLLLSFLFSPCQRFGVLKVLINFYIQTSSWSLQQRNNMITLPLLIKGDALQTGLLAVQRRAEWKPRNLIETLKS